MARAFDLRKHFELGHYATTISRKTFEANFTKTKEKVVFTFNGWDGKSYNGESRQASVYRTNIEGFEKATGECHPVASWLVDAERA